jgi:hypothetical protein
MLLASPLPVADRDVHEIALSAVTALAADRMRDIESENEVPRFVDAVKTVIQYECWTIEYGQQMASVHTLVDLAKTSTPYAGNIHRIHQVRALEILERTGWLRITEHIPVEGDLMMADLKDKKTAKLLKAPLPAS